MAIRKITLQDREYPRLLRNIHRPPKELYINGTILDTDEVAIAIVGSRRASLYGLEMSEKFGYELAQRGITVVSGMARGIDTSAHRGALRAGGRTIAVMGSGHGHIYPKENKELYARIAMSGAVVTEYEDGVEPLTYNFPQRNRIISGLSLGVIVVEAAKDSGALITANLAADQGREVFALPGRISSSTSSGTNALIKDGAKLVQSVDDILEELSLDNIEVLPGNGDGKRSADIKRMTKAYMAKTLTADERKIYGALSDEPSHIDDIVEASGLGMGEAMRALLSLQLKKMISEVPGKNYVRKDN